MNARHDARRTAPLVVAALAWAAAVTFRIATIDTFPAKHLAIGLSLAPGAAMFAYVIARPTGRNIAWRMAGALVGLVLLFHAAYSLARGDCHRDGFCALIIFNGVIGDVVTSGIGWVAVTVAAQRADYKAPHG